MRRLSKILLSDQGLDYVSDNVIFVNFSEISEINEKLKIEEKDFKLQKDRSIFGHQFENCMNSLRPE